MKTERYDVVRNFRNNGWRVFRIGPQGGQNTIGVYTTEEAARRVCDALSKERTFEL